MKRITILAALLAATAVHAEPGNGNGPPSFVTGGPVSTTVSPTITVEPRLTNTSVNTNLNSADARSTATALSASSSSARQGQMQGQQQGQIQGQAAFGGNAVTGASTSSTGAVTVGTTTSGNAQTLQAAPTTATINEGATSLTVNEAAPPATTRDDSKLKIYNTPDAVAMIASPTAPCRIQMGAGASVPGIGISAGGSVLDEGCDAREDARLLHNLGLQTAAVKRLCAKPEMAVALGVMCPAAPAQAPVQSSVQAGSPYLN
jgi:hypothetical protein